MNEDVTLLSSIKEDEVDLFSLNYHSVHKFNPGSKHKTVLVNNTNGKVGGLDEVTIVPGLDVDLIEPLLVKPVSDEIGLALILGLRAVDTRYICILDPDYFVVCPYWIELLKAHMEAADVGIITSPPYPQHYNKRNTVTNNFMFVDTEKFPKALINFLPSKRDSFDLVRAKKIKRLVGNKLYHYFIKNIFLDCGDQIEMRAKTKIERLTALYNHKQSPYYNWRERIIPARFRLVNRNVPYIPYSSLKTGFEVWLWNGIPFGVHCRKFFMSSITDGYEIPMKLLRTIVYQFLYGYRLDVE